MNERKNIPFTAEHFTQFVQKMQGQPYWYGTCLYPCTKELYEYKRKQYPEEYDPYGEDIFLDAIQKHKIAADCSGALKGYAWTNGAQDVYESIGKQNPYYVTKREEICPDLSSDDLFAWACRQGAEHGTIDSLKEAEGIILRWEGHMGFYIGKHHVIEWRNPIVGCVMTIREERPWTHWYKIPFLDYGK